MGLFGRRNAATLLDEAVQPITTIAPAFHNVTRSISSLPMRALKMMAPSRGMGTIIARPAPFFNAAPGNTGAAFLLPRMLPEGDP